jgi:hypothetical protein
VYSTLQYVVKYSEIIYSICYFYYIPAFLETADCGRKEVEEHKDLLHFSRKISMEDIFCGRRHTLERTTKMDLREVAREVMDWIKLV